MSLYAVTADYRPNNPNKPIYYIYAESPREAKQKFQSIVTWLKVYDVVELDKGEADKIIADGPMKHIVFN